MRSSQHFPSEQTYREYCRGIGQSNLMEDATKFFNSAILPPRLRCNNFNDFYQHNFIIGETHSDISPKKILIENMHSLHEAGFTTLFLEHLYYDDQALLDDFYESGVMSDSLREKLLYLDGHCPPIGRPALWDQNNFLQLVIAARKAGIRTVAIDTKLSYEAQHSWMDDTPQRLAAMNYTAAQIIQRETMRDPTIKWFSLIGGRHIRTTDKLNDNGIPGLADLTGALAISIQDNHTPEIVVPNHRINIARPFIRDTANNTIDIYHDIDLIFNPEDSLQIDLPNLENNGALLLQNQLFTSVLQDDVVSCARLIKDLPINQSMDDDNNTIFMLAAAYGKEHVINMLLQRGADPTHVNNNGVSPIIIAASYGNMIAVQAILKHITNQNYDTTELITALELAITHDHISIALLLIPLIDTKHLEKSKILNTACVNGNLQLIETLIKRGLDVNLSINNTSLLMQSIQYNQPRVSELLLKAGANIEKDTGYLIQICCVVRNIPMLKYLLENYQILDSGQTLSSYIPFGVKQMLSKEVKEFIVNYDKEIRLDAIKIEQLKTFIENFKDSLKAKNTKIPNIIKEVEHFIDLVSSKSKIGVCTPRMALKSIVEALNKKEKSPSKIYSLFHRNNTNLDKIKLELLRICKSNVELVSNAEQNNKRRI